LLSLVNGTHTLAMCTMITSGPSGSAPLGWSSPYAFQFTPITALVIAQAPGW
jgi:hypothetical protein